MPYPGPSRGMGQRPSGQDLEERRRWGTEGNRRYLANRAAIAAIRLEAETGARQACDDLALIYKEDRLRDEEYRKHHPFQSMFGSSSISQLLGPRYPTVPAACTAPLFEPPTTPLVSETDPLRMETVTHRLEAPPRPAPTQGLKPVYIAAGLGILALAIFGRR